MGGVVLDAEFLESIDMGEHSSLRPHGFVEIHDPDAPGGVIAGETLQCCHCGGHWIIQPGSGKVRGFCLRCNGPFCGPDCAECRPLEQQIEQMESGLWLPGGG